jgi:hypothetical protein
MENTKKYGPFYNLTSEDCTWKDIEETDKYYINTSLTINIDDSATINMAKKLIDEEKEKAKELANNYNYLVNNYNVLLYENNSSENDELKNYRIDFLVYSINTSKNDFKNKIWPECLKRMRTNQLIEMGGPGSTIWLDYIVEDTEYKYYYIEIDKNGNIVSDSRTLENAEQEGTVEDSNSQETAEQEVANQDSNSQETAEQEVAKQDSNSQEVADQEVEKQGSNSQEVADQENTNQYNNSQEVSEQ